MRMLCMCVRVRVCALLQQPNIRGITTFVNTAERIWQSTHAHTHTQIETENNATL